MTKKYGNLFIVATPIGNLSDMSFRAIDTLKNVEYIACEDTRVTKKLLLHYDITKKTIACHHHTHETIMNDIIADIMNCYDVAYVSDAGTPGVSDPGNKLVHIAQQCGVQSIPIPGACAVSTLISVSGIDMQQYIFMAYPPHKKGRVTFFDKVNNSTVPVVYYDSVHRVLKNLQLLADINENISIIVGRELTKMYEEIIRGKIAEVIEFFEKNQKHIRGEFVIIVHKKTA